MMNTDITTTIQAAMFAALGSKTKFSRSGNSIVFVTPALGRHDLSELRDEFAIAQCEAAGIDIAAVTPAQIEAYQAWHSDMYETRRIAEARILVTRPFRLDSGRSANRVSLIDGWGEQLGSFAVPMIDRWEPDALNRIGTPGAFCFYPDADAIQRAVDLLRREHPEFAAAAVQNNNVGQLQ